MYIPAHFKEDNLATLHALMQEHPLGAWVTLGAGDAAGGLVANHIPFHIDATRGEHGTLVCHVARANPVWRSFSPSVPSVVMFQGASRYITPSWYASKAANGKVVPTWNYAVVHAHGIPVVRDDKAWMHDFVTRLTDTHEAQHVAATAGAKAWHVSDAPDDYIDTMLHHIVGIEIPITTLVGKWKVQQNHTAENKQSLVAGLEAQSDAASQQMARMVRDRMVAKPST
jgi:transcriptional regulator